MVALVKVRCLPPPGRSAYAVDMPCVMHVHRTCMCMCVHACRRRAFIRVTYASSALSTRRSYAIITTSWSSHSTVCRRTTGPTRCVPHACMPCAQLPPHARCQKVHAWHVHAVAPSRPHRTISDLEWRPTPGHSTYWLTKLTHGLTDSPHWFTCLPPARDLGRRPGRRRVLCNLGP